jgi:ELWxxDGT repeat protein
MIEDIRTGSGSSQITSLTEGVGNRLYFVANDGTHGAELWTTSGYSSSTSMVKDIDDRMVDGGGDPKYLTALNNRFFFVAKDAAHGAELWVSDGTEGNTRMVKDIHVGIEGSGIDKIIPANNRVYFVANDAFNGKALWTSDGTAAGTQILKVANIWQMAVMNNQLYFLAEDKLWVSNGTLAGTQPVQNSPSYANAFNLVATNNLVYFSASSATHGQELWASNGTAAGTRMVKDIAPGATNHSNPNNLAAMGNQLYFVADDGTHGEELWKTDGTEAGTQLVKDLLVGNQSLKPANLTVVGSRVFFTANDQVNGRPALWVSSGTAAGTRMLKDISSDSQRSPIYSLKAAGNQLYFVAQNAANGRELWTSDGTEAGTRMVRDINVGVHGSFPNHLTVLNNKVYFNAFDPAHGFELWVSNGTEAGTKLVEDMRTGVAGFSPSYIMAWKGSVYFSAFNDEKGRELFQYTPVPLAITDFSPSASPVGARVAINGTGFSTVKSENKVRFNGTLAIVRSATKTQLWVSVPIGATTGKLTVEVEGETVTSSEVFTVTVINPEITSFSPQSGVVGTEVTITGKDFNTATFNNVVRFNGKLATVTQASPTQLKVRVPNSATTGKITVAVGTKVARSNDEFKVIILQPDIFSFSPTSGTEGTEVVIKGQNFSTVASNNTVRFNGRFARVLQASDTELKVVVPPAATTGKISVHVGAKSDISSQVFTVVEVVPEIMAFSPTSGEPGDEVVITGDNFGTLTYYNTVKFNGLRATVVSASKTELKVRVPIGATTGKISVEANNAIAVSTQNFVVGNDPTGLPNQLTQGKVLFFPNPVAHELIIRLEGTPTQQNIALSLVNAQGRVVHQSVQTAIEGELRLNVSGLPAGKYLLKMKVGKETITKSLWKN